MTTKKYRSIITLIVYCACAVSAVPGQTASKNARTVLTEMLATYERFETYQDRGEFRVFPGSRSVLDDRGHQKNSRFAVSFRTFFMRPKMFRFDWLNSSTKTSRDSAIWFDGEQGYIWAADKVLGEDRFVFDRKSRFDTLINDTIKPSRGTVLTIPGLLIKSLEPYTFADDIKNLSELRMIKEQLVDGEMCYVISGKASNNPWLFWVGKRTSLLRKMRSFLSAGSFDERSRKGRSNTGVAEETHHNIRINEQIPEKIFRYQPRIRVGDLDLRRVE